MSTAPFWDKYQTFNRKEGREQYLVPYLMSSHPGCTLSDAVELAEFLHSTGHQPEQVQDFYPTPGTLSTCMYCTGIDPRTMRPVYVATDPHDKALQRALLQWRKPEMRRLVVEALHKAGREDLIGYGPQCLIRPLHSGRGPAAEGGGGPRQRQGKPGGTGPRRSEAKGMHRGGTKAASSGPCSAACQPQKPLKRKKGWAKPKKRK